MGQLKLKTKIHWKPVAWIKKLLNNLEYVRFTIFIAILFVEQHLAQKIYRNAIEYIKYISRSSLTSVNRTSIAYQWLSLYLTDKEESLISWVSEMFADAISMH